MEAPLVGHLENLLLFKSAEESQKRNRHPAPPSQVCFAHLHDSCSLWENMAICRCMQQKLSQPLCREARDLKPGVRKVLASKWGN